RRSDSASPPRSSARRARCSSRPPAPARPIRWRGPSAARPTRTVTPFTWPAARRGFWTAPRRPSSRSRDMASASFGIIGLAVMGRNLALNVEEHGFDVAVWNLEPEVTDQFLAQNAGKRFTGAKSLQELVEKLARPRRILMMIKAGTPVDMT